MTIGHLGALANGVVWGVPIGIWNLNFFYKAILGIAAFCIGMRYRGEMAELFKSKFLIFAMVALGAIALIYPFLSFDTKVKYFSIFYPQGSEFSQYLTDPRMPGLGLNANVYAFMVYSYLTFSFRAFLDGKISLLVPLIALIVILVLSSKLVIVLSVATCIALIVYRAVRVSKLRTSDGLGVAIGTRSASIGAILLLLLFGIVIAATQTTAGKRVVDSYATVKRFEAILSQDADSAAPQGLALRMQYWKKGMARAELAPVLGIAKDPFIRMSGTLVGFYQPHNEFLRMWLLYGLAGLVAWIYLLTYLSYKNVRHKTDVEWLIFYGALAVFMMFDGGLDDPRVNVYLFLMLGLSWGQMRLVRVKRSGPRQPSIIRDRWVPST
jgi:O-antigen ligase